MELNIKTYSVDIAIVELKSFIDQPDVESSKFKFLIIEDIFMKNKAVKNMYLHNRMSFYGCLISAEQNALINHCFPSWVYNHLFVSYKDSKLRTILINFFFLMCNFHASSTDWQKIWGKIGQLSLSV